MITVFLPVARCKQYKHVISVAKSVKHQKKVHTNMRVKKRPKLFSELCVVGSKKNEKNICCC